MKVNPLNRLRTILCDLLAVVLISACSAPPQRLDPHFGACLEAGLSAQAINPNAPSDPTPADTMPGDLADQIYKKRYLKTMTEEKKEKDNTSNQLSGLD
ncbi:conserved exported hypothetical protein [Desulfosarcina cetonica]|uniref:hypothetical protein n=1 Tax=Desulfosarcina cetonica TaxID=90730 RepID=UPI0006CF25FC|nr:hypothetical protein [Desulfosarcina cetonica]VTR71444.1 conserved exported hypothetical protein [Desulfosarcina cetonica]